MQVNSLIKPPKSKALKAGRVKLLYGEEVGEHVTDKREELIIVLKGNATLQKQNETIKLKAGEIHYIKEGVKHNIRNDAKEELEYIYVLSLFE